MSTDKDILRIEGPDRSRASWSGKLDFLFSCLSYAVGLGNLWRFPYLCYSNGGGAFLIPYVIMLFFAGIPIFFMELCFGQFASTGIVSIWKVSPLFQGIGWAMFLVSTYIAIYYNMVIAWAFYYLFASINVILPWKYCDNQWNTDNCRLRVEALKEECHNLTENAIFYNRSCYVDDINIPQSKTINFTVVNSSFFADIAVKAINFADTQIDSASNEFFHREVLKISSGIDEFGSIDWSLAGCLLLSWIACALCLINGIKSSGKAVYFTALFPYVVLIILLAKGLTLEGSLNGIKYYLTPQWERLKRAKVWGDAAVQIFFSLSPCWGGLITLASYNPFRNNTLRDSLVVSLGNCATSVFAGFAIFAVLGHMAHLLGKGDDIGAVVAGGPSLAFVVYPEVLALLPISSLWAFLFFAMLVTLGLGTQFATVNTIHTTLVDIFPNSFHGTFELCVIKRKKFTISRGTPLMIGLCCCGFIVGLLFCTNAGIFWIKIFDTFAATYSLLLIGLTECCALSFVYGLDNFFYDISMMLGKKPHVIWLIMWKGITPALLAFIMVFTWVDFTPTQYNGVVFPAWADSLGWCMSLSSVMFIPLIFIGRILWAYFCHNQDDSLSKNLYESRSVERIIYELSIPTNEWGPADKDLYESYRQSRNFRARAFPSNITLQQEDNYLSQPLTEAKGSVSNSLLLPSSTTSADTVPPQYGSSLLNRSKDISIV